MINRLVRIESKDDLDPLLPTPIPSTSTPVLSLEDIAYLQNTGQQSLLDNILASTSSPTPSPSGDDFNIMSVPHCFDGPVPMPEYVAEWLRMTPVPWDLWITWLSTFNGVNCSVQNYDQDGWVALAYSPVPARVMNILFWHQPSPDPLIFWPIPVIYSGREALPTSVPGTTITETIPAIPAPQMPNEVRPLINSITSAVTQQISSPILESSADLSTISTAIEAPYIADLEDISTTTTNLTGDIIRPQVTAINQLYDDTYPVGISPPTVDQIISGEIPYNPNLPAGASTCPAPIINVAPAAVSCPAPAAITFAPQITVNVPQQDRPTVSVSTAPITIDVPAPVPAPVAEVPEAPIVEVVEMD